MPKKAATTTNIAVDRSTSGSAAAPKKSSVKEKKHLKAQAAGVAAAVEGFVQAITGNAVESSAEEVNETAAEKVEAPISETPVHHSHPAAAEESKDTPKAAQPKTVTEEEIAILAFEHYLKRGGQNGSQAEDWLRAEQILRSE